MKILQLKLKILKYILLFTISISFYQCSVKNNTWLNRKFHALTTKYNVLFHGKESLKEGEMVIKENFLPNYDDILPVFESQDKNARANAINQMERALEKAQKAIELHSITRKPRRRKGEKSEKYKEFRRKLEYNNLIDECYLLMAKAQYYKGQYDDAEVAFKHLNRNYNDDKIRFESEIWNARNFIEQQKYILAFSHLENIRSDPEFPKKFDDLAYAVEADIFLRQRNYEKSIAPLEYLSENAPNKAKKAYYRFILSRVLTKLGMKNRAVEIYNSILKMNAPYELKFQSELSIIQLTDNNLDAILLKLNDMLKNKKNLLFNAQIYNTIAEVYAKKGDREMAAENYLKAISSSTEQNSNQKAIAHHKLGDYYFENENYLKAKENYDNVFIFSNVENFEDKELITQRLKNINELLHYLNIVVKEDSLQRIASLSNEELDNWVESYQKKLLEMEALKKTADSTINTNKINRSNQANRKNQQWYFDNESALAMGKKEFQRKWGNRILEDNWRRRSRTSIDKEVEFIETFTPVETETIDKEVLSKDEILADFPLTKSKMITSHNRIKSALFSAGIVYELKLNNINKAVETYQEIEKRYPYDAFNAGPIYNLYNIYKTSSNIDLSKKYETVLLEKYPESVYAKLIKNPGYLETKKGEEKNAEELYKNAFKSYKNFEYNKLVEICNQALTQYPDSDLKSKFLYLKAIGIGQTQNTENFMAALNDVITTTQSDDDIQTIATDMLAQINEGEKPQYFSTSDMQKAREAVKSRNWNFKPEPYIISHDISTQTTSINKPEPYYTLDEKGEFYYVLILPNRNMPKVRVYLNQYNKKNFRFVSVKTLDFDANKKFLVVEKFKGKNSALNYLNQVVKNDKIFNELADVEYRNFIISKNNFHKFRAKKDIGEYVEFYVEKYLGNVIDFETVENIETDNTETQENEGSLVDLITEISKLKIFKKKKKKEKPVKTAEIKLVENENVEVSYIFDSEAPHNFVLLIPSNKVNTNQLWTSIYYHNVKYKVSKINFYKGQKMFVVRNIGNYAEAMSYLREIVKNKDIYGELKDIDYRNFIISKKNLELLTKHKALNSYIEFFKKNYLNN